MRAPAILLSAWLGAALLFATVVAPSAFAVLPSRALAGALVGRVLPVLFVAGLVAALVSLAGARRAPRRRLVLALLVVIGIACAAGQFVVAPRIARVRAEVGGAIDSLSREDPRRRAFGRLHAVSVAWLGVAMLAAAATVALTSVPSRTPTGPRQ